jgi:hypothetical protein
MVGAIKGIRRRRPHSGTMDQACMSPDGKWVASLNESGRFEA